MKKCFFAATMLAVFTLASCSQENGGNGGGKDGEPTRVQIVVKHASSTTTRSVSAAPTSDEKKLNDMTLYVFNSSNVLEKIVAVDVSGSTYVEEFETTTGWHHFVAVANIPTSAAKPSTLPAVGDLLGDVQKKLMVIASLDDITKDVAAAHFFMSTNVATQELKKETSPVTDNKVTLSLVRGMAKVTVSLDDNVQYPNGTLDQTGANKVEFFVANNPKSMFFLGNYSGVQLITPNYASEFVMATSGLTASQTNSTFYFPAILAADDHTTLASHWKEVVDNGFTPLTDKPFHYAVENSNVNPAWGESTYAMITGLYVPKVWGEWNGTTIVDKTAPTVPTTFYRLGKESALVAGTYTEYFKFDDGNLVVDVFSNINTMTSAEIATLTGTADGTYKVVEYTNGRTYYGMWLMDIAGTTAAEKYCVERNDYFDVVINEVKGPGSNTPIGVIPNPPGPIEESTFMECTIEIKDWNVVSQNGSIG